MSDAGLEHLKALTDIVSLDLTGTQITGVGLEHLTGLTNLKELYLRQTQVSDAGLQHLKSLTNLVSLDLAGTQVTDTGLEHLKELTDLTNVDLRGSRVSAVGIQELVYALPQWEDWSGQAHYQATQADQEGQDQDQEELQQETVENSTESIESVQAATSPAQRPYRTWKDSTGAFSVEAMFIGCQDEKVQLKRKDGTVITVPLGKLCDGDRKYVAESLAEVLPREPLPPVVPDEEQLDLDGGDESYLPDFLN